MSRKVLLSWSSGKDSAWMAYQCQKKAEEVVGIFSTINEVAERVAMHGVRLELLKLQAHRLGLPLHVIHIPSPCTNKEYEARMERFIATAIEDGVSHFSFGDLFLQDVKEYRIKQLLNSGIQPMFPLWETPTDQLALEMIDNGLKAIITCVDPKQLPKEFVGRTFDNEFLQELPKTVDPCGENGEFHSFVYDGPMFSEAIDVNVGEIVHRDGFYFADVKPAIATS